MSGFKGFDSLEALLALINNKEELESTLSKIRDATNSYVQAIEGVTKLSEVNSYTESVRKAKADAEVALSSANERASKIVQEAEKTANDLKEEANKIKEEALRFSAEVKERLTNLNNQEKDLHLRLQNVRDKELTLEKRQKVLNDLQAELEQRKAKLLAAIN